MLVKFNSKESPLIFFEKDYSDIIPLLEMVKQKAVISIFLDQNGDRRVTGRFYDFEYVIDEKGDETLLVIIETSFNNIAS